MPRLPYRRFHDPTRSSGWKKAPSPWISPVRDFGALRIPELVEGGDRGVIEHSHRWHERRHRDDLVRSVRERGDLLPRIEVGKPGVVAAVQHTAAEVAALGHEVDPGDAVAHLVVGAAHRRQQRVEIGRPATCRRSILLVSIGSRRMVASIMMPVRPMPPIVAQNSEGLRSGPITVVEPSASIIVIDIEVVADRAVDVMVLAVNVAGDRSADRHESCAGRDGNEEAPRHDRPHQLVEADARPDGCAPGGRDRARCRRRRM